MRVSPGSLQMCFGSWESVGVCGHVISLLRVCECECLGIQQDDQFSPIYPRADCHDS